jgi:hypothetical protein
MYKNKNSNLITTNTNDTSKPQTVRLNKTPITNNSGSPVSNQDITIMNNSPSHSPSGSWTTTPSKNKRNHSSSSEQNSPKIQNNKKLFFTSNHYEVLSQDEPVSATISNTTQPDSLVQYTEETLNIGIKPTLPPPIFVRGVINF